MSVHFSIFKPEHWWKSEAIRANGLVANSDVRLGFPPALSDTLPGFQITQPAREP